LPSPAPQMSSQHFGRASKIFAASKQRRRPAVRRSPASNKAGYIRILQSRIRSLRAGVIGWPVTGASACETSLRSHVTDTKPQCRHSYGSGLFFILYPLLTPCQNFTFSGLYVLMNLCSRHVPISGNPHAHRRTHCQIRPRPTP